MSPSIEISSDLYVALRTLMHPEDRTPSDVIWRLVEEHHVTRSEPTSSEKGYWQINPSEGLHSANVTIPNGLRLRGQYKRNDFVYGEIRDAKVWIGAESHSSPSAAAGSVARSFGATGAASSINGWKFWEFESPKGSGRWRSLDSLRGAWETNRRDRRRAV
jgi:hypothetical protein